MFFLNRPTEAQIRTFLRRQRRLARPDMPARAEDFEPPAGYTVDRNRVRLGDGPEVYERACDALRRWEMFRIGWAEVHPRSADQAVGSTVAMLARGHGLWCLVSCRVIQRVEGRGAVERTGFVYGTLPGHLLTGEERFAVTWDRAVGSVWFTIVAFSRPASLLGAVLRPFVRQYQRRFAPDALKAMARAVSLECVEPTS